MEERYCSITLTERDMRRVVGALARAIITSEKWSDVPDPDHWRRLADAFKKSLAHPHVNSSLVAVDLPRITPGGPMNARRALTDEIQP